MAVVDFEAAAQGVQIGLCPREFAPRHGQGVGGAAHGKRRPVKARQFGIDESHIERGVVNHHHRIPDEGQEVVDDVGKDRLVIQKFVGQPVNGHGAGVNLALGIDIDMKLFAAWRLVQNFQRTDFNDAVSLRRIDAGGFGIQNNLAHHPALS